MTVTYYQSIVRCFRAWLGDSARPSGPQISPRSSASVWLRFSLART